MEKQKLDYSIKNIVISLKNSYRLQLNDKTNLYLQGEWDGKRSLLTNAFTSTNNYPITIVSNICKARHHQKNYELLKSSYKNL